MDEINQADIDELLVELEYLRMLKEVDEITKRQDKRRKELEERAEELGFD